MHSCSKWAKARYAFAVQLQQQFRPKDRPDLMMGVRVVKLFDGTPFVGKVVSYDVRKKWYTVLYSDGDSEELTLRELRVKQWPRIDRRAVLWLDEKVSRVRV